MKKLLCVTLATLFLICLMPLIVGAAKAENAATTWGAIKNAGMAEAAPPAGGPRDIQKRIHIHYPRGKGGDKGKPPKPPRPDNTCGTDMYEEYKYARIHWRNLPVHWYYDVENEKAEDALGEIQESFNTWAAVESNWRTFYTEEQPRSTPDIEERNVQNTFGWRDLVVELGPSYSNAIAVTIYWYYRGSKELVEVDTWMNTLFQWAGDADLQDGNQMDVQNIATHEIGHWLNLGDLYYDCASELTMYGYSSYNEVSKRILGKGDELGIQKIY